MADRTREPGPGSREPETGLPGIVVAGPAGRMGRMLVRTVLDSDRARLVGAVVRKGHPWAGRDLGKAMDGAALGITVGDDTGAALAGAAALVDFTTPEASIDFARAAAAHSVVHVVGTTGFSDKEIAALDRRAGRTVTIRAGNMSLGVNLLVGLTRRVAAALDEEFDIEVVEAHHRNKVDAPSGTALMLGAAAADGRGVPLAEVRDPTRDGVTGARGRGRIGFSSIRGGDIVGEHDVVFAGAGERVVLRHIATDRRIFARGALRAALWGIGQTPGIYDMGDVLGI